MRWANILHNQKSRIIFERTAKYKPLVQTDERASFASEWEVRFNGSHAFNEYGETNSAQSCRRSAKPCLWWKVFNWLLTFRYIFSLGIH